MGMTSPNIAGQVQDTSALGVRRSSSTRMPVPSRKSSAANSLTRRDSGLNKRAVTAIAGGTLFQPRPLVRKTLPWLEGQQETKSLPLPANHEPTGSVQSAPVLPPIDPGTQEPGAEGVDQRDLRAQKAEGVDSQSGPSVFGKPAALRGDRSLRANGSMPSLRSRAKKEKEARSLSLDSNGRPNVKQAMTQKSVPDVLGLAQKHTESAKYTSSEYSNTPSSTSESILPTLQKKSSASYERRINDVVTATEQMAPTPIPNDCPGGSIYWTPARISGLRTMEAPRTLPHEDTVDRAASDTNPKEASTQLEAPVPQSIYWTPARTSGLRTTEEHCNPSHEDLVDTAAIKTGWKGACLRPDNPASAPVLSEPARLHNGHSRPWENRIHNDLDLPSDFSLGAKCMSCANGVGKSYHAQVEEKSPRYRWTPTPLQTPPTRQSPLPGLQPGLMSGIDYSPKDASPRATKRADEEAHSGDLRHASMSMSRAVIAHENLMNEALTVAKDAAQTGRHEELAGILDNATSALRKVSTVHGHMSQPLVMSDYESGRASSSASEIYSDCSSHQSREGSAETAPTLFTKSAQSSQPFSVQQELGQGERPAWEVCRIEGAPSLFLDDVSMSPTPPALYQPPSAESIVRDYAYKTPKGKKASPDAATTSVVGDGRSSHYLGLPAAAQKPSTYRFHVKDPTAISPPKRWGPNNLRHIEPTPTNSVPSHIDSTSGLWGNLPEGGSRHRKRPERRSHPQLEALYQSSSYHQPDRQATDRTMRPSAARTSMATSQARYDDPPYLDPTPVAAADPKLQRYSAPAGLDIQEVDLKHPRRNHISLREGQGFSLGRHHKRQPIAREWSQTRKRITAAIACSNTVFIGLIAGIYAGEVPRIQYQIADTTHKVILGNVLLFVGLGLATLIFWPLPLLHGRKPYTLTAFALMLPLQFPQALAVSSYRDPASPLYRLGLLVPRVLTGIAMGFANINFMPTLLDLFGASLMSEQPHQEIVLADDMRRQGGGIGLWLGIWAWCYVGSLSIGFCIGAAIIANLDPSWGFYIVIILLAFFLLVNVLAPETRRSPYRRSISHFLDEDEKIRRRVARGEVKLHISNTGPRWWFEELWAGIILTKRMIFQPGFFVLMLYLAWIFAEVTLIILLLGALLSRDYQWQPQYVGLAALSIAVGAFFAMPLTHAGLFSRSRDRPARTDSMTFQKELTWTSHMVRRCLFTLALPIAGLAYTVSSSGPGVSWVVPTVFAGLVGFLSNLAISECVGLIMESFDTCDLQPGINSKHRLQSLTTETRRRRTNYSSFPRVCAGFFAAQSLGFFLAAACTGVSGTVTRAVGSQIAIAIVTAILMLVTVLLIIVLWRWKSVQVIPDGAFGTRRGSAAWGAAMQQPDGEWKAVIIGNPSGKLRRMNLLEMGAWSRWTEIRRLNKLVK